MKSHSLLCCYAAQLTKTEIELRESVTKLLLAVTHVESHQVINTPVVNNKQPFYSGQSSQAWLCKAGEVMKINTNSWHYRLWRDSYESIYDLPKKIDLCRYCHRVFWQVVGRVLAVALGIGGVGYIVSTFYVAFILHFFMTMKIIGIVTAVLVVPITYVAWLHRRPRIYSVEPKTLVGKWVQARKQRVCPMVEFTDGDK